MVRLNVVLRATARSARDLQEALRFLMIGTRLESGCLGCWTATDPDGTVYYAEEWATDADIVQRVRSSRFTALLSVIELSTEPPRVQFDFAAGSRGLDYVEEVRHDLVN